MEGVVHRSLRLDLLVVVMAYGAFFTSAQSQPSQSPSINEKNARVQLASEFVRELEVLYRLQETAKKEFAEDGSSTGKLMTSIRLGTRSVLEMNDSIRRLDA